MKKYKIIGDVEQFGLGPWQNETFEASSLTRGKPKVSKSSFCKAFGLVPDQWLESSRKMHREIAPTSH